MLYEMHALQQAYMAVFPLRIISLGQFYKIQTILEGHWAKISSFCWK